MTGDIGMTAGNICAFCGVFYAVGTAHACGTAPYLPYGTQPYHPPGCICPPMSEQTCQATICPRRGLKFGTAATTDPKSAA